MTQREVMEYDVVVVGAGPAGLSTAIRLRQQAQESGRELSVCVLEKGAAPGAHSLAGAVLEPRALDALLPNWREDSTCPVKTQVTKDSFCWLTQKKMYRLPTPPAMHNEGNYIISLGRLVGYLAAQAEAAGADIFPGFAAAEVLYDADGAVCGVATGDMGIGKDGAPTANHQPGVELRAAYTVFAEGCRGSLSGEVIKQFNLRRDDAPQTYGIGIKELWESDKAKPGEVLHTVGWPLPRDTYGGSFLYHLEEGKIALGFVVGLDYRNPYLSPYMELQKFKHHPAIAKLLQGGRRIGYGARALNEGGWQSIPQLVFPGGLLAGCAAGFLNVAKIKGIHTAMQSGISAADTIHQALQEGKRAATLQPYEDTLRQGWVGQELRRVRNIRPMFRHGLWAGMSHAAVDTYLLRGHAPWTFKHHADHSALKKARECKPIDYPKPDGKLSFSRLENLAYSGVNHEANQPAHLRLRDDSVPVATNLKDYAAPEERYCPAGVYEYVQEAGEEAKLVINAQNCVHCKTCDIKDPTQNIHWTTPEGGGGPNYDSL